MSRPQDWYPVPCPTSSTIAASGKDRGCARKSEARPSLESLQRSIWKAFVELTSLRRKSLPSIESSSWPKLASRHPCDGTCHFTLWLRDGMWLCVSLTSKGSNIEMASILPWHTWQSSIHPELWIVASIQRILGFEATCVWIPVISSHARATAE